MLRLQLTRSMHGTKPKLKATIKGLGFKRTHQIVERLDTPEIRGMINKVTPWITVIEGGK
ncbi:MAG: 50S ribosomal protein L30 [Nitrospirota bacterium]|nr:50S ribosomal protein L30 [Nitrospirota bacterium]